VAAFLSALLAAIFGQTAGHAPAAHALVAVAKAPHVLVVPTARSTRVRACSTAQQQQNATARKVLPVACEEPPRSQVTLPNAATGTLSSLFGSGR